MNYKRFTIVIFSLLALVACEKEDINISTSDDSVNEWIEHTMRENYLWYSEMPSHEELKPDKDPQSFFQTLLSEKDGKDLPEGHHYFSRLEKATTTRSIFDTNDSYGFDFAVYNMKSKSGTFKTAIILYVLPNSPASDAGLKRGDWILGINGPLGSIKDFNALRNGGSITLHLGKSFGNEIIPGKIVTIEASRPVEDTPFLKDSIYFYGNKRIGYLMYNHFATGPNELDRNDFSYDLHLRRIFTHFKSQDVNELILDLRYNGGGLLTSAQLLASLIAPKSTLGEPMCIMEYNDKNLNNANVMNFLELSKVETCNLNLPRLFVLTGTTTASASELVINSLRPYIDVQLIGEHTLGKTVGMTVYNESATYGWILSPVTFRIYNKLHEANYENGFYPNIQINEFDSELKELGDIHEPLLACAISEITGASNKTRSSLLDTPQRDIQIIRPNTHLSDLLIIHEKQKR